MNISRKLKSIGISLFFFLIGISLTTVGYEFLHKSLEASGRAKFESDASYLASRIKSRMQRYAYVAYGVRGLFDASDLVERGEFQAYVDSLDIEKNYPGLDSIRYIEKVKEEDTENFTKSFAEDTSLRPEGYPDFSIHPENQKGDGEYWAVKYIYPEEKYISFLGFDVRTDPIRKSSMEKALFNNQISFSEATPIIPSNTHGFVMSISLFKKGTEILTPKERELNSYGFINLVIDSQTLLSKTFAVEKIEWGKLKLQITDRSKLNVFDPEKVLFDTRGMEKINEPIPSQYYQTDVPLNVSDRTWNLHFFDDPQNYQTSYEESSPLAAALIGTVLSILVAMVIYILSNSYSRAADIADSITKQLRLSEEELAAQITQAPDPIILTDQNGLVKSYNNAAASVLGLKHDAIINRNFVEIDFLHPDSRQEIGKKFSQALSSELSTPCEIDFSKPGESQKYFEMNAKPVLKDNKISGIQIMLRDISKRKEVERSLQKRTQELEMLNKAMIGRELKMAQMKRENALLKEELEEKKQQTNSQ